MALANRQARKYSMSLAGEFLVAGELLRRGVRASITYGNAKKADVVAVNDTKAASIEVKTTSDQKWVIGNKLPTPSTQIWVLVFLPEDIQTSPRYFILSAEELHNILLAPDQEYRQRYQTKHGHEPTGIGVVALPRKLIPPKHEGAWEKISQALTS